MSNIMDYTALIIHDKYGRRTFNRIISANKYPNYFATGEKPQELQDLNVDEVYFFPISMEEFKTNRRHKFYGLKYIFSCGRHDIVRLGQEGMNVDASHVQLMVEVQRFRYYIKNKLDVYIDKECDTLYPPRIYDIETLTIQIGFVVLAQTNKVIDELNGFYMNKKI